MWKRGGVNDKRVCPVCHIIFVDLDFFGGLYYTSVQIYNHLDWTTLLNVHERVFLNCNFS